MMTNNIQVFIHVHIIHVHKSSGEFCLGGFQSQIPSLNDFYCFLSTCGVGMLISFMPPGIDIW